MKFAGIDSISDAETLLRCELQVPASARGSLEPGWNYISDLVGAVVVDNGREIGTVQDVRFGAGEAPLLVVRAGAKEHEIPYAEAFLKKLDFERRRIEMSLPEGLLEINGAADRRRKAGAKEAVLISGPAMKIEIVTIFPDFFREPSGTTVLSAASVHRAWRRSTSTICGPLRMTGTTPWMTALSAAARAWCSSRTRSLNVWSRWESTPRQERVAGGKQSVVLLSAQGKRFDQSVAQELSALDHLALLCGRYEGVDERVGQGLADRELSIGDYVLSGGELGAAVIVDAVTRLIPGRTGQRGFDPAGVIHC